jgi:chorismate synthase
MMRQQTVNNSGETIELEGKGRHDPCVLPRAVPIVESMAALVVVDFLLLARSNRI